MRSQYCTTIELAIDGEANRHLTYSSLSGNVALVDNLCQALLDLPDGDLRRDDLAGEELAQVDARLSFLSDRGFWITGRSQDEAAVEGLVTSVTALRRELLQLLFVFHPGEERPADAAAAVDRAVATLPELITRFAPKRCHLHFWVFEPGHVELFQRAVDRVLECFPRPGGDASGNGSSRPPKLSIVVNTHGLLPLDMRPLRLRFGMNVVLKVVVDRQFVDRFATLDDYLTALYAFLDRVASQGQASNLFLNANRGSEELFRDVLLERFMERGLNRAVVTRYYLSAVNRKTELADFHCDLDRTDWDLWNDLLCQMAKRPRYRMFTLYGGGIVPKFQGLLNFKKTLLPDIHFCPLVPNAITFDLAGNLWVCPKTAFGPAAGSWSEPVGRFLPALQLDEERLRSWWDWNVRRLPGCMECPDAFVCSGGCPLAVKRLDLPDGPHEGECQPVPDFLATGVRENVVHLSRAFGPGVRSR